MGNRNFVVGIFVAVALAAFVAGTIWLTGKQGSQPTVSYSMYFETDVSGLMLGGPVFFLGVEVGSVTAMEIIPGDPMRIRVDAKILKSAPINSGTYASLAFQGITGVAVIKLSAKPGEHQPITRDETDNRLVIAVEDTGFSAVLAKAPNIVDKLDSVLVQINQVLGEENREFVATMLEDISTVTSALASQEEAISEIPVLLETAIRELNSTLAQIRSTAGELEPGLEASLENLNQSTRNLAGITERLDEWAALNDSEMKSFMQDGLGQIPALVTDARAALREVEKLMNELQQNPSRLMYQPQEGSIEVER
jgi:phospholipid/cholesterol/gamma-HCH transport system substrate-binding protein